MLLFASVVAIFWTNSPWIEHYNQLFHGAIIVPLPWTKVITSLHHMINDGLMSLFFLLVTLEVKREIISGELNTRQKAVLPLIAALGGIILPALIYLSLNWQHPVAARGWAIPTATDIAFSLAIVMLLRDFVPASMKIFLTALAIIDDLGAIIIIAVFYTTTLYYGYLLLVLACIALLGSLNYLRVTRILPYLITGFFLWLFVLNSGFHSTIAGVLLALFIPHNISQKNSPLLTLEHRLQPWVSMLILPLFALANTGLVLNQLTLDDCLHPITLGIIFGLLLGKQLGIFLASYLAIKTKIAKLPHAMTFWHLYGLSILCGIGFTMSLFIGELSFGSAEDHYSELVKFGVLTGSVLSALLGSFVLFLKKQ